ncbi:Detected protein of unknown function [Hibiscus syriacus]|uniref:Uncharacterized protein n=1 Tax=Hibiscus syriacus TaxID=106335 RepID=A0A6A2WFY3_HIBSY|nr:Detected protein of unknown function [Hibiscus syriacus]
MAWTGHDGDDVDALPKRLNLRTHPADVQVLKYLKNGVYPPSIAPDLDRAPGISPLTHATTSSLTTSLAASGLSGNSVTVEIPAVLGSLPHLKELYLDNNHIHGPIPSIFNNLTRFKRLEIQRNYIFDEFPDLGSLRKIYFLDASDNSASVYMTHDYGSDTSWLFQKICISFSTWGYAIFAANLFGHGRFNGLRCYLDLTPPPVPPNTLKKKRRCRKRKTTPKNWMSTSSVESGFFTSGSFEDFGINDRETETLVSSSRSFSNDSPSEMFNTNLKIILKTKPTRQSKKKPKKIKKTRRYAIRFSLSESESPARLSSFLQWMILCTVDGRVRESFVVVKK